VTLIGTERIYRSPATSQSAISSQQIFTNQSDRKKTD
jgi:hypothetical protein